MADMRAAMLEMFLSEGEREVAAGYIADCLRRLAGEDEFVALIASMLEKKHPLYRLEVAGGKRGGRRTKEQEQKYHKMRVEIFERIEYQGEKLKSARYAVAEKYGYSPTAVYNAYKDYKAIRELMAQIEQEECSET